MAAGKGEAKKGKGGGKKGSKGEGREHEPMPDAPQQMWPGPLLVTTYGSTVVKMVGYRKADNTVEWWGMCKGFRLGPSTPGAAVSRTFVTPASAPVITNVAEFVAWALPILQQNNPDDPSFDWEICTVQNF